jgi:hypothetical protein
MWRTADLSVHVKLELEDKVTDETQQDEKSEEDQNVHPENLQRTLGYYHAPSRHISPRAFLNYSFMSLTGIHGPAYSVFDPVTVQWTNFEKPAI